ncbi:MAG: type II toxin-antitoxin system HicB family antitoxin [Gammaproteobacteria bacterium]
MNTMTYDSYKALIEYDDTADMFHGRVLGTRDVIDFYGKTPNELRKEFKHSVEAYFSMCKASDVSPEKRFSGKFTLRPTEEQHRQFAMAAAAAGNKSLNAWAISVLEIESHRGG